MSGRRGTAALSASPVLVGAVTVLVAIVAVFLSYNANSGLPFVPTYDLKASLPDASNIVRGNEVRVGGARVGVISSIEPVPSSEGDATAEIRMQLDKALQPLPMDSTFVVRPRSALGLKYVELTPGRSRAGFAEGDTVPLAQATPHPVELDDLFNTFDAPARRGARGTLNGFGEGLAGRGVDLNTAIVQLKPLLRHLQPVAANLADPRTRLVRLFPALGSTAAEVRPAAETQAALMGNLDTTFGALATVARPFLQETISESPPTLAAGTAEFPRQRPFLRNAAALSRELRPGIRTLPASAPQLADALEFGVRTLPRTPPLNRRLADSFDALARFSDEPLVGRGLRRLAETMRTLRPTLTFLAPVQTTCNYVTLFLRNVSSLLSEGDTNGTWQRFIIITTPLGPNAEGSPSSAPANGPTAENHLHANPYPNTAAPGQVAECEAGNESYRAGATTIGNVPGGQGRVTDGQEAQR